MGGRPAVVPPAPVTTSVVSVAAPPQEPPRRPTWSGRAPGVLAAVLSVAAVTPLASWTAVVPPLLVLSGEAWGRRALTIVGLVTASLYVVQRVGGLPTALVVAVAIALGTSVRVVRVRFEAWVHRAVPPAFLLGLVLVDQLVRPAVTVPGQYAVLEQVVLLTCLVAMLVGGRSRGLDEPEVADTTLHGALVWVSLVAGADGLRALSVADAETLAARQAAGVFGASNYVAALLALATVACVHRACTGRGRPVPNVLGAVVFIAMAAPQASRTSTIVFAVVVLVLLVRHRRHLWFLLTAAGVAVLLVLAPAAGVIGRFRSGDVAGGELNGRTELWAVALDTIREHPVLGSGAGRISDSLAAAGFGQATYVHDVWLSLVAQFGLAGLIFLVIGTGWILTASVGSYGRTLAITGLLLSTTEPVIETMKMGLVLAAVLGACAAHAQRHDQEGPRVHDLGRRRVPLRSPAPARDGGVPRAAGG